jgi:hypothetical protein
MKIWGALSNAAFGWMMILRGEAGWQTRFALTLPGLVTSLVIFLFCAFLAVAMASTYQGMPNFFGVLDALAAQALWILVVFASLRVTAMLIKREIDTLAMLVPAVYLLVGYLLVGSVINLVMPPAVLVLTLALVYPFHRLGRAGGWPAPNALGFAVLTTVLLVAVPLALYMLTSPASLT